jgi:phenylalanyl-tRNA synthetase alpha chain
MDYRISLEEQERVLRGLAARKDAEAERIRRYMAMPDLSRTPGSPLAEIVERARQVPALAGFDNVIIPEVVPTDITFDLFDFAPDHPARSKSDTYYIDERNILRTHDTVMWYYYTQLPEVKARLARREKLGVVCYGKVYRKDEIDRKHMNIFHQFGGWYMTPADTSPLTLDDLRAALTQIVKALFGADAKYRFLDDTFPYTDPSLQVEVWVGPGEPTTESSDEVGPDGGKWIEILGGGMTKQSVFKKFGVEGYNAWAFGFGLERLAIIGMELPDIRLLWSTDERVKRQLKLGQKFIEVSKYPPVIRDISFIVPKTFSPNDYFDLVRDIAGDLVEQVELIDEYSNDAKFGADKKSYAYRIIYRSSDRTLTNEEVDVLHKKIEEATVGEFGAVVR